MLVPVLAVTIPFVIYAMISGASVGKLFLGGMIPALLLAFVAAEDQRFFTHPGIDVFGIARAAQRFAETRGKSKQGGSTITQQLAKNLFFSTRRSAVRKLQELVVAAQHKLPIKIVLLNNGVFVAHMSLALLMLMLMPFSKLVHFGGIFFTHQLVRKH